MERTCFVKVVINPNSISTSFALRFEVRPQKVANLKIIIHNLSELPEVMAEIKENLKGYRFDVRFNFKNSPMELQNDENFQREILGIFSHTSKNPIKPPVREGFKADNGGTYAMISGPKEPPKSLVIDDSLLFGGPSLFAGTPFDHKSGVRKPISFVSASEGSNNNFPSANRQYYTPSQPHTAYKSENLPVNIRAQPVIPDVDKSPEPLVKDASEIGVLVRKLREHVAHYGAAPDFHNTYTPKMRVKIHNYIKSALARPNMPEGQALAIAEMLVKPE